MTLDEAITKLEELAEYYMSLKREPYEAALRIGIEALERLKQARTGLSLSPYVLLPSETEGVKE